MKTKRPQLGQTGFEVEWCYELPMIEGTNEADMDNRKYRRIVCPTMERAMERAKAAYPEDKFGAVLVTPVEYRDPIGEGLWPCFEWEPTGDPFEYSGD